MDEQRHRGGLEQDLHLVRAQRAAGLYLQRNAFARDQFQAAGALVGDFHRQAENLQHIVG